MFTLTILLSFLAIALYLTTSVWQSRCLVAGQFQHGNSIVQLASIAWCCHLGVLIMLWFGTTQSVALTMPAVFALILFVMTAFILLSALKQPVHNLLILTLPLSAISLVLLLTTHALPLTDLPYTTVQLWHIGLSILAFSVLFAAALQAALLALGETLLRHKRFASSMASLPPLETMEQLLFQIIAVGFALLSLVLLTSLFSFDNIGTGVLLEKTLLTSIAWGVFLSLLLGRHFYGWRGRTAINGTLLGMTILILSYFGTRLFMAY